MDIGTPLRDLGPVPVAPIQDAVRALPEEAWTQNEMRQDVLADPVHNVTQAIIFKHEWHPTYNSVYFRNIEDLIVAWAKGKNRDPQEFWPIRREETDAGPVYTFREWNDYQALLQPVVDAAIAPLRTERGVIARIALVRLQPVAKIAPHVDGHVMAYKAHRIHVPVIAPPGVSYKIGGQKFTMQIGRAYDFNNRIRHSVENAGKRPRVNLFIDYYPNPGIAFRDPLRQAG